MNADAVYETIEREIRARHQAVETRHPECWDLNCLFGFTKVLLSRWPELIAFYDDRLDGTTNYRYRFEYDFNVAIAHDHDPQKIMALVVDEIGQEIIGRILAGLSSKWSVPVFAGTIRTNPHTFEPCIIFWGLIG